MQRGDKQRGEVGKGEGGERGKEEGWGEGGKGEKGNGGIPWFKLSYLCEKKAQFNYDIQGQENIKWMVIIPDGQQPFHECCAQKI